MEIDKFILSVILLGITIIVLCGLVKRIIIFFYSLLFYRRFYFSIYKVERIDILMLELECSNNPTNEVLLKKCQHLKDVEKLENIFSKIEMYAIMIAFLALPICSYLGLLGLLN